ncbi:hypothetical protein BATDEDRAFT_92780 [Batrachochytrium dendrobatidis JAM81]|uniref:Uncharacterized protein n=1 Tax=Batrachochytrium dendrobatidis (strain JAM81 / FGSC 10211) TaxID=684364 RepID=F4PEF3_BATDJ|nr:uncharacterized protein BATDEDRAFT_92780 [Batrachochytrium dendrobatidis JAM81]EGF76361.1 hypothetical protein BATDEDRAFT_92780 [Batrachochytrium dendrobatidis JAM81]|eukprot:XP_006682999.1 hypothetical protein BATDEDRAFT_92780 [Batrachochytrium dendrobatidis JAM81]
MKFIDITITAVTAIASVNAIAVPESDHVLQARSIPQPNESQVLLERRSPSSYGGVWGGNSFVPSWNNWSNWPSWGGMGGMGSWNGGWTNGFTQRWGW